MTPVELIAKPATRAKAAGTPPLLNLDVGEQYRFGFDMTACIGCHSCEVACAEQNGLPATTVWRRVGEIEGGEFPETRRFHLSMSCNHCLEPACLEGCPTNAYEKLANGIVVHHADDCIGCQYCTWNCPYSVPAFQPDRRIVTKCDMCRSRLDAGRLPACVDACPTHAITIEAVDPDAWRADHTAADAPALPSASITLSTTRIALPSDVPLDAYAVSDWNIRPEHPHWSLVWLTTWSQLAVGVTILAGSQPQRAVAAVFAAIALIGATFHLGRPAMAYKALRNLRRSWLSREVAFLSLHAALAGLAVVAPSAQPAAGAAGALGVYASARLYLVPGRPAWDSPITVGRFAASAAVLGALATGHRDIAIAGAGASLALSVLHWVRLRRSAEPALRGALRLELRWFRRWTLARGVLAVAGVALLGGGAPIVLGAVALVASEIVARWLFYVTVVPRNMPGAFWRGAAGSHR